MTNASTLQITDRWQLEVNRTDLATTRVSEGVPADRSLREGEVLLKIDTFAMTANNITYAVFGDAMAYWQFFPVDAEWGVVPVWGFADVMESTTPEVKKGQRYYGYWPCGSHLIVQPTRIGEHGFVDGAPHRRELPAVYNSYSLIDTSGSDDDAERSASEALQSLLRPLFTTSFFIDDVLAEQNFHGAEQVVIASASSKTAFALAFCLHRRGIPAVGLTSSGNVEFVKGLGWYDEVLTYDETSDAKHPVLAVPSVYVDMSGNATIRSNMHHHADLRFDLMVGATHWDATGADTDLPGPAPELFFAPSQIAKRNQDWGPAGVAERTGASWGPFIEEVAALLQIEEVVGAQACKTAYLATLNGSASPTVGLIVST